MGYSMTIGGAGLIAGAMPTGAKAPLQSVATTGAKFVAPMSAVTGAGMVMDSLGSLNRKIKRRKK